MAVRRVNSSYRLGGGRLRDFYRTSTARLHPESVNREYQLSDATAVDTFIDSLNATTNWATNALLFIGESNVEARQTKVLIKPPLNLLPANIYEITAAYLDLTITLDRSSTGRNYKMYRVLRDWNLSQATWNIWSTGNNWTTAGCEGAGTDFDNTAVASVAVTSSETVGAVKTWSITPSVIWDMYSGITPNYGFAIRVEVGVTPLNDAYVFASSADATSTLRPKWRFTTVEAIP